MWAYKSHKWQIYKVSIGAYAYPLWNMWWRWMDGGANCTNDPGLETLFTECFHLKPETTFFLSTLTYESVTHSLSDNREGRWQASEPSGKSSFFLWNINTCNLFSCQRARSTDGSLTRSLAKGSRQEIAKRSRMGKKLKNSFAFTTGAVIEMRLYFFPFLLWERTPQLECAQESCVSK